MYLTTTLAPAPTTSNFSSLQTINLQRKPLPPIPQRQVHQQQTQYNNIQRLDQQHYTSRAQQQQKSTMQYYTEQPPPPPQKSNNHNITKNPSIISQEVSLLEQVPVERATEFASHMTCFLWFGDYLMDPHTPSIIAPPPPPGGNGHRRYAEYKPRDAFKKFCKDVISATQVSHSVILLSLLYIHRMKINNPTIKGQSGSEYRTFTVALMLANKFLDDNTYTNKTWSEVTNIPVSEINTMEMEFLSSLDYELYVSEQQYFEWLRKMDSFIASGENDDNSPDCAMIVPQQVQYSQSYLSAEQAFDGIMVSPPKRTSLYPVYTSVPASQQLVVQSSQPQYTQTIAYPTPPSSSGATQQVTYYNLPTTTSNSSSVMYTTSHSSRRQQPQQANYDVRSSYSTSVPVRTSQAQYTTFINPMVYITARRMQSNLINSRPGSSGFPINNLSFPTTVV
ncbi:9302_t:CDS:2 [Funneliformis caledonium]|uniref:9302_t:CDS:1 n=1 Tax=Funneliformis caledonium TaxID=1117310 RepID=A0A9N8W3R0_9GLOM|nr:9302_t:CDS:2 [Funneliformis caledonium]